MIRTTLLVTALLAFAAIGVPAATAQGQFGATTTEVMLGDLEENVAPGERATIEGVVRYTYTATGQATMTGTVITMKVADAPEWATVVVTPSSFVIPTGGTSPTTQIVKEHGVKIQVHLSPSAPAGESAIIKIQADASANSPLTPSQGTGVTMLATKAGPVCNDGDYALQSATAGTAVPALTGVQMMAAAGMAATVGLAGFFVGRRQRPL